MKYEIEYHPKITDFEDVYNIEKKYLAPSTIASVEKVVEWETKNNDINIFIRDKEKNKIIGEITLIPLSEEQFNKFMINNLEDVELNKYSILKYENDKEYYLLFSAIAIDPEYRSDRIVLSLLLTGLYNKIKFLQNKNIKFLNMCAEGQTSEGQQFIKNFLDLKLKKITNDGYMLYSFDNTNEFDLWLEKLPKYIDNYNNKFNLKY